MHVRIKTERPKIIISRRCQWDARIQFRRGWNYIYKCKGRQSRWGRRLVIVFGFKIFLDDVVVSWCYTFFKITFSEYCRRCRADVQMTQCTRNLGKTHIILWRCASTSSGPEWIPLSPRLNGTNKVTKRQRSRSYLDEE